MIAPEETLFHQVVIDTKPHELTTISLLGVGLAGLAEVKGNQWIIAR